MKRLSVLIKPASALCNIRCKYCFYADISSLREVKSHGKMKQAVMEKLIDNIFLDLNDGDEMLFAFQGGEPTIAGLSYFKSFVSYVKLKNRPHVKVSYSMQTNGILIDEQWCEFFKEHRFLLGISIDGGAKFHDVNRVDARERGTYERVLHTKKLFDVYGIDYNVLCVLTNQNARHPEKIFQFLMREKIKYVQFIPCLDDLEQQEKSYYALEPKRFAHFYNIMYQLWCKELQQGNYVSINFFDNIINYLQSGIVGACGLIGQCQPQYVIESDGSVYPCDFYALDENCMGFITENTLRELFQTSEMHNFLQCSSANTPNDFCEQCPFFKMCRGGCKRMKHAVYLNKQQNYCGYQTFLQNNIQSMLEIAGTLRG